MEQRVPATVRQTGKQHRRSPVLFQVPDKSASVAATSAKSDRSGRRNEKSELGHSTTTAEVTETTEIVRDMDPNTGNKMINQYMIIAELGRGCHGKVKLAVDVVTGEQWAIKVVDKSTRRRFGVKATTPTNLDKVRREIAILKKCVHPQVVRLREVIDAPDARKMYLVLEYVDRGEIKWKKLHADQPVLSIQIARRVFRDVVLGLEYLHYQGIIHRDIKPANLLWTKDHVVKISDFGVSHVSKGIASQSTSEERLGLPSLKTGGSKSSGNFGLAGGAASTMMSNIDKSSLAEDVDAVELAKTAGSPAFFAPELCTVGDDVIFSTGPGQDASRPSSAAQPVTKAIDVWALGVTLYCFVYGRCPFMAESEYELFNLIPKASVIFPNDRFTDERASQGHDGALEEAQENDDEDGSSGEDGMRGRFGDVSADALKVYDEEEEEEEEQHPIRNLVSLEDRYNAGLGIVDDSLRDLISRLLEKDASKRITLDEVKRHPWVTVDLPNAVDWYNSTNPSVIYNTVEVSEAELKEAVTTLMGRIRDRIRKISSSLSTLASGGARRRTRSMPSSVAMNA